MARCVYNRGAHLLMANALGATALDLRMAYVYGNVTGVIDRTLNTVADVDGLNAGATNISTERLTLTGEASTEDDANNRANVDAANPSFGAVAGQTALAIIIYHEGGGTDATRELVTGYSAVDMGGSQPVDGGLNVTINDFMRANALAA